MARAIDVVMPVDADALARSVALAARSDEATQVQRQLAEALDSAVAENEAALDRVLAAMKAHRRDDVRCGLSALPQLQFAVQKARAQLMASALIELPGSADAVDTIERLLIEWVNGPLLELYERTEPLYKSNVKEHWEKFAQIKALAQTESSIEALALAVMAYACHDTLSKNAWPRLMNSDAVRRHPILKRAIDAVLLEGDRSLSSTLSEREREEYRNVAPSVLINTKHWAENVEDIEGLFVLETGATPTAVEGIYEQRSSLCRSSQGGGLTPSAVVRAIGQAVYPLSPLMGLALRGS